MSDIFSDRDDKTLSTEPESVSKPTLQDRIAAVGAFFKDYKDNLTRSDKLIYAAVTSSLAGLATSALTLIPNMTQAGFSDLATIASVAASSALAGVTGFGIAHAVLSKDNVLDNKDNATDEIPQSAQDNEPQPEPEAPQADEPSLELTADQEVKERGLSLAAVTLNKVKAVGSAIASSPVGDIAYILFKTDDAKTALQQFSEKTKSTGAKIKAFFSRKKDIEVDVSDNEETESKPKSKLLGSIANVPANLAGGIARASVAIAKEWKTIGTTAAIIGGTRWGLTALAGLAGAPVIASLAVITGTCGVIAGSLKTHAAYRSEKKKLLSIDALAAAERGESFSSQEEVATSELSFREFMEQNKGLLSSNIAKSMAAASVGSAIGYFAHNVTGIFDHSPAADEAADQATNQTQSVRTPAPTREGAQLPEQATSLAPATAPAVNFAAAPIAQKLEIVRSSIQGEPSAYISNRLTAAASGNAQAMKDVARALYAGEHGVPADQTRAVNLYEQAAQAGNRQAVRDLAYIRSLSGDSAPIEAPQADQAPVGRSVPRAEVPTAPRASLVTPDFLSDLPTETQAPAGNTDLLPVDASTITALAAPQNHCGLDITNLDPGTDSMGQFYDVGGRCDVSSRAGTNDFLQLRQNGVPALPVRMLPGETVSATMSRITPRLDSIKGMFSRWADNITNRTPIAAEDVPTGYALQDPTTGTTVTGRGTVLAFENAVNPTNADVATAANDNGDMGETIAALNGNESRTERFANAMSTALGLK